MTRAASALLATLLVVASLASTGSTAGSSSDTITYTAAVVQHYMITDDSNTPQENVQLNMDAYEQNIIDAAAAGVQVIVFPETGLGVNEATRKKNAEYGEFIPDPEESIVTPCDEPSLNVTSPALVRASCLARKYSMIVQIGMVSVVPCNKSVPDCPHDDMFIYNTAIVLNESGELVARYYKYHIFFSLTGVFNIPTTPMIRYYDAAFGVRFGMFVCFDILFEYPAEYLTTLGITDFTFSSDWTNVPPIVTAIQTQQGWSRRFGVNLVASNQAADHLDSGSGIYSSGQPLQAFFSPTLAGPADQKMLIANLTTQAQELRDISAEVKAMEKQLVRMGRQKPTVVNQNGEPISQLCGLIPGDCDFFEPVAGQNTTLTATKNNLTCTAEVSVSAAYDAGAGGSTGSKYYALFVTDEVIYFSHFLSAAACGVVHCVDRALCIVTDPYLEKVYFGTGVFNSISITADFTADQVVLPLVATAGGGVVDASYITANDTYISVDGVTEPLIEVSMFVAEWSNNITMIA